MNARIVKRCAAALTCMGMATAVLAGSCAQILGIEELSGPEDFTVSGIASGVLGPVALELYFHGGSKRILLMQEGPFAFEIRLEDGASYGVELVDPSVPCVLRNNIGVIEGANTAIELTCTGPSLASVVVSGIDPPVITLMPGTTEYAVDLPVLQQSVTFAATVATPGDTLVIAGTVVASGEPGAPIPLGLGNTPVDIVIENRVGWQRTYRVTLRRAVLPAQVAYGKASNIDAGDEFGASVALSGDTLAVGAHHEDSAATGIDGNQSDDTASGSGAVYVFRRAGTAWQQEAYLKASNTGVGDEFGYSVALSGDTLAVGARYEASATTGTGGDQADDRAAESGAVYVFRRIGAIWQQEAYLKASNTGAGDEFGTSVALAGDTLAVGAWLEASTATGPDGDQANDSAAESGAVYVFRRIGAIWQQEAYLKASNTGVGDTFGSSVALSSDTLAVGAPGEDSAATGIAGDQTSNSASASGAVYVFRFTGTNWQQETYIKASNTEPNDAFGVKVAVSGDTLAVGALREDSAAIRIDGNQADNSAADSGGVYVFRRTGAGWQQEAYLKASNTGAGDRFGRSVAVSGDTLVVGAEGEASAAKGTNGNQSDDSAPESGAAYVFRRTGTSWRQDAYVKASNTDATDWFGVGLALSSDTLAVGAWGEASAATGVNGDQASNTAPQSGAVYIFH
jgi:hypothetical protein